MSDPTIIRDVISNLPAILTSFFVGGASVFTVIKTNRETYKMQKQQLLKINQLLLHDEHLPDSERINAGEEYVKAGGNGASRVYLEKLKERYKNSLEKNL
jgi:site-specific DNA-adenine methylase